MRESFTKSNQTISFGVLTVSGCVARRHGRGDTNCGGRGWGGGGGAETLVVPEGDRLTVNKTKRDKRPDSTDIQKDRDSNICTE